MVGRTFTAGRAALTAAAGLIALIVGLALGPAPLFVLGVGLLIVGMGAPAWTLLTARGVRVHRELATSRVEEGEPLEATLVLSGGWLGLPVGEIRDPLAREELPVPRGRRARIRVLARFDRRGLRTLFPVELAVHDPLELTRTLCASPQSADEVLVLPRTEAVRTAGGGGARNLGLNGRSSDVVAAIEVDGLRAYRPGTPASRIHWPALARGAGLLERKLRVAGDTVPLVVLDVRAPNQAGEDLARVDAAVRAAASLVLELARAGGCRLLLPGERRALEISPDLAGWPGAHARLAMIEGGPASRAPSPGAIQSALGPLFYVVAAPIERPPSGLRMDRARAMVVVLPHELASSARGTLAFTVSGCAGMLLGRPAGARTRQAAASASQAEGPALARTWASSGGQP